MFRPARMHRSAFDRRPGIAGRHLAEYAIFERPYALGGFDPTLFSSAGAVVSTVRDVDRFFDALLGGRLLARRLVATMATPLTETPQAYGLGIYALPDPCPSAGGGTRMLLGHDGASFGTVSISLSSLGERRQATVAFTGRDLKRTPTTVPPLEDFLLAALLSTCTTLPAGGDRLRSQRSPGLDLPGLDQRRTQR